MDFNDLTFCFDSRMSENIFCDFPCLFMSTENKVKFGCSFDNVFSFCNKD